jgi:NADH-quinone oxidoreductase subunit L
MTTTWITFMMGWLAILGVPPFSGFFSKDKIIEAAFSASTFGDASAPWIGWVYGLVAMAGAGITAFYMSRLFFMIFHGKARWTTEAEGAPVHPHESSPLMTVPMIILAIGAVVIGGALSIGGAFTDWLTPAIGTLQHGEPVLPEIVIQIATLVLVLAGAWIAWRRYGASEVPIAVPAGNALTVAARNDLYQDAVNESLFMAPGVALVEAATVGDRVVVDGAAEGLGTVARGTGKAVAATQTGYVRAYASYILGGVVVALAIVLGFML